MCTDKKRSILDEVEKKEFKVEAFLNNYFEELKKGKDEREMLKVVYNLKEIIKEEKKCVDEQIERETSQFKENMLHMQTYTHSINDELNGLKGKLYINGCRDKPQKKKRETETSEEKEEKKKEGKEEEPLERELSDQESEEESKSSAEKTPEEESSTRFENTLKKSIETKTKLENIRKGLIFLKQFPTLKKEFNELFVTEKNMKLKVEDKIKNAFTLHKHVLYINDNEEIINYFKDCAKINVSLYPDHFFDNFFDLLNSILCIHIFENTVSEIEEIGKVYIELFKTFLKYKNVKHYEKEYLTEKIIKQIIQVVLVLNFGNTFVKFAQSENDAIIYNSIIHFYEYFTTFIEEKQEILQNLFFLFITLVEKEEEKKKNCFKREWIQEIPENLTNDLVRLGGKNISECRNMEKQSFINDEKENGKTYDSENIKEDKKTNANYLDMYFTYLFKETIYVICEFVEKNRLAMRIEYSQKGKKMENDNINVNTSMHNFNYTTCNNAIPLSTYSNTKNNVFRIMDAIKMSLNILTNCPFFIARKELMEHILKEATFINKSITDNYILYITKEAHFDLECFQHINNKVSMFDRNNLLLNNKLLNFFTDMKNDIKYAIENKCNEINTKDIFNFHFFRFVVYFYFINNNDNEFLLLFINIYNILYEIIYNIKEEITKIKYEAEKNNKNKGGIAEESPFKANFNINTNETIKYIKNIIGTFTKVVNIFEQINLDYENFCFFLFEKTQNEFSNKTICNMVSKFYFLKGEKYPPEIESNILHIHNYFFSEEANKDADNRTKGNENIETQKNEEMNQQQEICLDLSDLEVKKKKKSNKYLFKSSLCKLNEIKTTLLNNIIYFSLIPLYDCLNHYALKIKSLADVKLKKKENVDPQQYICLIVDIVFIFIEIYYECKNENLTQQLFQHLSEKYSVHIKNVNVTNSHMILQIQADLHYLINVCKRFKIKNYKHLFLLYYATSFTLDLKRKQNQGTASTCDTEQFFQKYIQENIKNKDDLSFQVTEQDIISSFFYVQHFLSHWNN